MVGPTLSSVWTQFHPPNPQFTERDLPDLKGKVYIVTGSNTGIGKDTARMLYSKNATVYIGARSGDKANNAIEEIKKNVPNSTGALVFLSLDLSDLNKAKAAAQSFLQKETKLHVLFNNAGVMVSPAEPVPRTAQGYELGLGVNCLGTFLFTKLLTPLLVTTAKSEPIDTVRVVWVSSFGLELFGVKDVGISLENLDYSVPKSATERYGISKCGSWALGVEFARRHKLDGIVSLPINPGNLTSELARDQPIGLKIAAKLLGYPTYMGACTEIFAGLSPQITIEKSGSWSEFFSLISIWCGLFCVISYSNYHSHSIWKIPPPSTRSSQGNKVGDRGWYRRDM